MVYLSNVLASSAISSGSGDVETSGLSLEQRMLQAYANKMVSATESKSNVLNASNERNDPESLMRLQQMSADYNLDISLMSTLARKAVGAVETVLRS